MRIPFEQPTAVGRTFIDLSQEITAAILRTIEAGWEIAHQRAEVHAVAKEIEITECLRDGMREALVVMRLPWRKTMIVAPGTESRSRQGMTVPDGRTDIPLFLTKVFSRSGEHDPHAIIECKRVADGDATLTREYVLEGVDRFRTGKYAGNHRKGFMAGYVLSGAPSAVVRGINSYLGGHGRSGERLAPSTLVGAVWIWTSRHPRGAGKSSIELHHAMLTIRARRSLYAPVAAAEQDRKRLGALDGSAMVPSSKRAVRRYPGQGARADLAWQKLLDEGVYASVSEIGDAENISKSYVSRIGRLAVLAPDIIEAMLAGRTEHVIMLKSLERPLPASWEEQRAQIGRRTRGERFG